MPKWTPEARLPWPVHMVGVGEVEANTGELQNYGKCYRRLASTGPDQGEGNKKSEHDECEHSVPPDSAWNCVHERLPGMRRIIQSLGQSQMLGSSSPVPLSGPPIDTRSLHAFHGVKPVFDWECPRFYCTRIASVRSCRIFVVNIAALA